MNSVVHFLYTFIILVNISAILGVLYFLVDRQVCLRDAYVLLRLLKEREPQTYRYLTDSSPFPWFFIPQRLNEFLLIFEHEEDHAIKLRKQRCRCWMEYYDSLTNYLWRIIKIALAAGTVATAIVILIFGYVFTL